MTIMVMADDDENDDDDDIIIIAIVNIDSWTYSEPSHVTLSLSL